MAASTAKSGNKKPRRPPATTPQARENQLSALAYDLAETQIRNGTASSQVITHFLKAGSRFEQLQKEKIILEQALLKARVENIASSSRLESLTDDALKAFRLYSGQDDEYY